MLKIKVCGLTDPANAEGLAKVEPDFMGFIFYPGSRRFVGINPPGALFSNIPPGVLKTGVFVDDDTPRIIDNVNSCNLDLVQLHGKESPGFCKNLQKKGLIIIKAFQVDNNFNFTLTDEYMDACEYFLFDAGSGSKGGSGVKFDWEKLNEYHNKKPFFLAGGIGPEDSFIIRQISHDSLFAVDINSRFEISPGIKDIIKVQKFINDIKG